MTKAQVIEIVGILSSVFPDQKWSEATCKAYELFLVDLDYELAQAAVRRLASTAKFRPSIAEIRESAAVEAIGEKRSGADAWGDVIRAIRYVGSYGAPSFDDPFTARAVEALGWRNLCLGDSSEASDRARFCEVYDAVAGSERRALVSEPGRLNDAVKGLPSGGNRPLLRDGGPAQAGSISFRVGRR